MPQPGDPYADAFVSEAGQCWRMVHDRHGQAAHCLEPTSSTGRWYSPRDDGTYWRVWSCPDHPAADCVPDEQKRDSKRQSEGRY
jgi:hypothetical protein